METPEQSSSSLSPSCSSYSPLPPSIARLWRPSAQRNLRNQWSNLNFCRKKWASSSFGGRSHANSLVNVYLSQKYMPSMELGVLSDMPDIRKKACLKLFKQQEGHRSKLLSSYREMVSVVAQMVKCSRSMRCYVESESTSLLVQFSNSSKDKNESGDGGGIPVYTFWSISSFGELEEIFSKQLSIELPEYFLSMEGKKEKKRKMGKLGPKDVVRTNKEQHPEHDIFSFFMSNYGYLPIRVSQFFFLLCCQDISNPKSILRDQNMLSAVLLKSCEDQQVNDLSWSNELYPGEFDELSRCNLYPKKTCQPAHPGLMQGRSDMSTGKLKSQTSCEILQVYLTTWLADVNINGHRLEEIFAVVGEEMHVSFA